MEIKQEEALDARAHIEVVLHPTRIRILQEVAGRKLTVRQIAELLSDVPQTTLYRHLKILVQAEQLKVVEERPVRGTMEKLYALGDNLGLIGPETAREMSVDDWMAACKLFAGSVLGDFSRYLRRADAEPVGDLAGMRKYSLELTHEEFGRLLGAISALIREAGEVPRKPDTHRWVVGFSSVPGSLAPEEPSDG
jgi:DNA-binding transcriptional ArsR family regulator